MDPILNTKVHIPAAHPDCIQREALIQKLDQDLWLEQRQHFLRRLTLIAAPAGYGKSTLLSEWVRHLNLRVAWITFDDADDQPGRFAMYLAAALKTVEPGLALPDLRVAESSHASVEFVSNFVISLVNELAQVRFPILLVFDDYHTLQNREIHQAVTLLLEHLPQNLSLVIATRADPPLPLSRLRARRQMAEVRAGDLKFSEGEAGLFFKRVMNLDLQEPEVGALTEITEGWVAGLQMAALALQGRSDQAGFIRTFSGRERFIIDYLFEEVLSRQNLAIQKFLMQTSILELLSGPVCDAVWVNSQEEAVLGSGGLAFDNSQAILEYLERANLFLVALDDERQTYRYHHLFADLLRHRLQREAPELVPQLHARAATWFEEHNNALDAFEHWLAAGNVNRAAEVVERYGYPYFEKADFQRLSNWLERIPVELIGQHPWLCVYHSWDLIFVGRFQDADRILTAGESMLGPVDDLSPAASRELYGHLAASRAFLASRSQDAEGILRYSDLALRYVPAEKRALRGFVAFFVGTARYKKDQYSLAQEAWRESARLNKEAGNHMIAVNSLVTLSELNRIQGKLREALGVCQEAALLAMDEQGKPLPVLAEVQVSRARLFYEWNDLAAAEADFAEASRQLGRYVGFDLKAEYHLWLSRLRLAQGNTEQAAALIHEIEASDRQMLYKTAAGFLAWRIHYYLTAGDQAMLSQILGQQDWNLEDKNIFAWAEVFIAYARVLAAQNEIRRAEEVLERCRTKLEALNLWTPAIKALIVQARIAYDQGETLLAQKRIQRALTLAEGEGYVRVFVDEGAEVKALIEEARSAFETGESTNESTARYIDRLLVAFSDKAAETAAGGANLPNEAPLQEKRPGGIRASSAGLIDPLTERELEVLQLIAEGFSNKEIAEKLVVTVGTVKTHTSNIYRKLDVIGRTKALARARELNLIVH